MRDCIACFTYFTLALTVTAVSASPVAAAELGGKPMPFTVKPGLFDHDQPQTLGLERISSAQTFTIFAPDMAARGQDDALCAELPFCPGFNHNVTIRQRVVDGAHLLRATWQACPQHEDSTDGIWVYSDSCDQGMTWPKPRKVGTTVHAQQGRYVLKPGDQPKPRPDPPPAPADWEPAPWHQHGQPYVRYEWRYYNTGYFWSGSGPRRTEYSLSQDGVHWSSWQFLQDNQSEELDGYLEPMWRLPNGRLITWDGRMTVGGIVASRAYYTDDPAGIRDWTLAQREELPGGKWALARAIEPGHYVRADGMLVAIFRDLLDEGRALATMTEDGIHWTPMVQTDLPDKQSNFMGNAGRLPDGTIYILHHASPAVTRRLLALTLSDDGGRSFTRSFLIRSPEDLQPQRYVGRSKDLGFSYPSVTVTDDYVYICYTPNKEDVQVTRIPLEALQHAD